METYKFWLLGFENPDFNYVHKTYGTVDHSKMEEYFLNVTTCVKITDKNECIFAKVKYIRELI